MTHPSIDVLPNVQGEDVGRFRNFPERLFDCVPSIHSAKSQTRSCRISSIFALVMFRALSRISMTSLELNPCILKAWNALNTRDVCGQEMKRRWLFSSTEAWHRWQPSEWCRPLFWRFAEVSSLSRTRTQMKILTFKGTRAFHKYEANGHHMPGLGPLWSSRGAK